MDQEALVRSQMDRRRQNEEKKLDEEIATKKQEMMAQLHHEQADVRAKAVQDKKKAEQDERTHIHTKRQTSPVKVPAAGAQSGSPGPVPFATEVDKAPVDPLKNPGIGLSPPRDQALGGSPHLTHGGAAGMDDRIKALMEVP